MVLMNSVANYAFTGDSDPDPHPPDGTRRSARQRAAVLRSRQRRLEQRLHQHDVRRQRRDVDRRRVGAPYTGTFKPQTPLGALIGKNPNGAWKLEVSDNVPFFDSVGSLVNWSLSLKAGTVTVTTSPNTGNLMDQKANATPGSASFAVPTPVNGVPFVAPYTQDSSR